MHEKKLVQRFIQELRKDKGLCSYGEKQVRNNLIMGAVDTLLLSEDLTSMRKKFTCPSCGTEKDITVKTQSEADNLSEKCPNCGEILMILLTLRVNTSPGRCSRTLARSPVPKFVGLDVR